MKMMNKIILFSMALLVLLPVARGQNKELMTHYQSELNQLYGQVFTAPTDNERYHANESVLQLLSEALAEENSFKWQWDFGNRVSVLTASDNKFRIFTWPVVNDAGEYECFGFVQALNEKTKEYDITQLNDRSDDIVNRQEEVLGPDRWLGAVYQELIVTTYEGRTFYTLLGWNGVDCLTQRRIIEPICFKSGGSTPQFGRTFSAASPTCAVWCWNTVTTPWCPSATRSNTCISPSASSPAVQAGPRWRHSSRRFSPTPHARAAASAAGEAPAVQSPRRHAHRQQCSVAATEARPTR